MKQKQPSQPEMQYLTPTRYILEEEMDEDLKRKRKELEALLPPEVIAHRDKCVAEVTELGNRIGYGMLMGTAQRVWEEKDSVGAFALGPCVGLVVPCGCEKGGKGCDWCEGSLWLTQKVKKIKDSIQQ